MKTSIYKTKYNDIKDDKKYNIIKIIGINSIMGGNAQILKGILCGRHCSYFKSSSFIPILAWGVIVYGLIRIVRMALERVQLLRLYKESKKEFSYKRVYSATNSSHVESYYKQITL